MTIMKRFAVFGNPIKHSYSPLMHSLFAEQFSGLVLQYTKEYIELDRFPQSVQAFFASGGNGLNVTLPFKLEAFNLAHKGLTARARAAGSVNTLWNDQGVLHGDNTDGIGLVRDIKRLGVNPLGRRILLIGAGGAARGAILPLLQTGCEELVIANRTVSKADELAKQATPIHANQSVYASTLEQIKGGFDLVINASSSSLSDAPLPISDQVFKPEGLAYDMLYRAHGHTAFLQQAQAAGVQHLADGLGMLVFQGAEAFKIWNQLDPDPLPVLARLRQQLNSL